MIGIALAAARPIRTIVRPMQRKSSVMRDPVHGDVYLTHEEIQVLDTPEMQRLRGVRQLGTAYLVYPGAVHTRFEHSIGTCHMAQRMIDAVNLNFELAPRECLGISSEEARVIRMAALCHDVTHVPFGHNVEDQAGLFHRHDSAERFDERLGPSTGIGRVLRGLELLEDVRSILVPPDTPGRKAVPPYWCQVVSDTICSDILDYLARDAYFTGLRLFVDDRIASYFKIDRQTGNLYIDLAKHSLLREDILSEIVRMLEARYYFSERVYYHHAKVAAGALVARAVEHALMAGVIGEADLYDETDASLLGLLEQRAADAEPTARKAIVDSVERLRNRRLYKRVCVFPRYANLEAQDALVERFFAREQGAERRAAEDRIAGLCEFATGRRPQVAVTCPARRMQLKEAATHVRWPNEDAIRPLAEYAERVPRLADLERSYRDLWKFYVFVDEVADAHFAQVQEIAAGEFEGAVNVYRKA